MLLDHMTTIRSMYDLYASANGAPNGKYTINSARLLSVGEWQRMVKDLRLGAYRMKSGRRSQLD